MPYIEIGTTRYEVGPMGDSLRVITHGGVVTFSVSSDGTVRAAGGVVFSDTARSVQPGPGNDVTCNGVSGQIQLAAGNLAPNTSTVVKVLNDGVLAGDTVIVHVGSGQPLPSTGVLPPPPVDVSSFLLVFCVGVADGYFLIRVHNLHPTEILRSPFTVNFMAMKCAAVRG